MGADGGYISCPLTPRSDRAMALRKCLWALLSLPVGAVARYWPGAARHRRQIDMLALRGIAALGAVGVALLADTAQLHVRAC